VVEIKKKQGRGDHQDRKRSKKKSRCSPRPRTNTGQFAPRLEAVFQRRSNPHKRKLAQKGCCGDQNDWTRKKDRKVWKHNKRKGGGRKELLPKTTQTCVLLASLLRGRQVLLVIGVKCKEVEEMAAQLNERERLQ